MMAHCCNLSTWKVKADRLPTCLRLGFAEFKASQSCRDLDLVYQIKTNSYVDCPNGLL